MAASSDPLEYLMVREAASGAEYPASLLLYMVPGVRWTAGTLRAQVQTARKSYAAGASLEVYVRNDDGVLRSASGSVAVESSTVDGFVGDTRYVGMGGR